MYSLWREKPRTLQNLNQQAQNLNQRIQMTFEIQWQQIRPSEAHVIEHVCKKSPQKLNNYDRHVIP